MGQMNLISSIFARFFFSKLSWMHFTDHTLQIYRLISPHCLDAQMRKQWRLTQIRVYIHVPFDHAVFIK